MDWNMVGAIGETLGAVGVIVTLIYLAGQLRQNTRALRSSAYQTFNERTDSYWDFEGQHAEVLGPIYEREQEFGELTSEEKVVLNAAMGKGFNMLEGIFLHYRAGTLDREQFEAKAEGFKVALRNPIAMQAWQRLGPSMALTHEFREFVNSEIFETSESDHRSIITSVKNPA